MPKEKIAIISILKPVDDTRSFHKMAMSLVGTQQYDLHLFGYTYLQNREGIESIHFHPHLPFHRLGFVRFFTRVKVLLELLKLKPNIIVVNTPELLIVSIVNKILFGTVLLYDIQENYYFNFIKQNNYPVGFKHLLGGWVRLKERLCSPIFDHFILAERSYLNELAFVKDRYTIIENKAIVPLTHMVNQANKEEINLLFSGTISKSNGIWRALDLHQKVNQSNEKVLLHIVGHCPDHQLMKQLNAIRSQSIILDISELPIPHERIEKAISQADIGLVCYELNPSNERCMPTKVFEYTAIGLPILFEKDTYWEEYIMSNNGGQSIDFQNIDTTSLFKRLMELKSTERNQIKASLWYETEEKKLINLFHYIK